jgi:hypothetical protein
MTEPVWIEVEETLAFHDRQIADHGGSSGIRDWGLLESALGKPKNIFAYAIEEASLPPARSVKRLRDCNEPAFRGRQ